MSTSKKESHWIPLADLMTVLMVIFLFISISYMESIQKKQNNLNKIFEEYEESKTALYNELKNTFKDDFTKWNLKLDNDLSNKFTNPSLVLFPDGKSDITPYFQTILKEFLPKYLSIVLKNKYRDKIAEIRIEGHTDPKPIGKTKDPYIDNMGLSQERAINVLKFLRSQNCFTQLAPSEKDRLQFWLTANGLSYGRTVDKNYKLSFDSKLPVDYGKSRRVEFRIITTSEAIIYKALNKIKGK